MEQATLDYLVCAVPRSGSSVFCDALEATGLAGRPKEYFLAQTILKRSAAWELPQPMNIAQYLQALRERTRTPNGVFGAKVMHADFEALVSGLPTGARSLEKLLPGLRYIRVTRRDTVRQAVSHLRAMQTNQWSSQQAGRAPLSEARYDFAAIDGLVQTVHYYEGEWDRFFREAAPEPIRVYYEEFVADQAATVRRVLAALGLDSPADPFQRALTLERQGDALNEEWAERYRAQKRQASEAS